MTSDFSTDQPLIARYLASLDAALAALAPSERAEVVAEIRQHIADAVAAGKPIDAVLESLGPVDALARAYQLELLVKPSPAVAAQPRSDRWLRILGLIAVGSLPTFIILIVLGTIGISFVASGLALILAGIADSMGALPTWVRSDVAPWLSIVLGVMLAAGGVLSSWGAVAYVRFVARLVRRVVPAGAARKY